MKLDNTIKVSIIVLVCCTLSFNGFAQSSRSSYFMETSYIRTRLNPALRPDQSYIGIPLLSDVYLETKTNTFNLSNLTFPKDGRRVTFMSSQISAEQALANISDYNYIVGNAGISLLSAGIFRGDSYWNFDLRVRTDADVNAPKELFNLMKIGFDENKTVTHDLSKMSVTQNAFTEIGVANSRTFLNKSLTLGVRAKMLLGISYIDLDAKSLSLTGGREFWSAKSHVVLRGAGPGISAKYSESEYEPGRQNFDGFNFGQFNIPGFGLGVDIGGVYDLKDVSVDFLKKLKVSYAINDIGFISWSKDNVVQLSSRETEVTVTPKDYFVHRNGITSINDIFNNVIDDIQQAINLHQDNKNSGYTTSLNANMVAGLEYEVWTNRMTAGFLYSSRFGKYFTTNEFTVSANYMHKDWLAATMSYSFAHSNFETFGLAVHIAPSKGVNFFLASDYTLLHISPQLLPTSSKAINLQVGVSVPFGGKRR